MSQRPSATIKPPSPPAAWQRGREAFHVGIRREDCPYPSEPDLRALWLAGWDRALAFRIALDEKLAREA